ncbi:MAG: alpha/beta hydrolase family protein [Aureispira sp.]
MNTINALFHRFLFVGFLTCCFSLNSLDAQILSPVGHWKGNLEVNGQSIPLVFHLEQEEQGDWKASFDSPNQMVYDMAFDVVQVQTPKIRLEIKAARVVYEGTLQEDGQTIKGNWMQGGAVLSLDLIFGVQEVIERPQTPKAPFSYDVETVEFNNKKAGLSLAGTLTLPARKQNCPAVVLISGSGPQDRNGMILKHQPFMVIADYLTRQGVVVLRVDDRGVGKSGGTFAGATSADFATDVAAALTYLQKHPRVNANKVGLLGHSEGGLIAPMVASVRDDVAFLILLAGPGYPGYQTLKQQNHDMTLQETQDAGLAKRQAQVLEKIYAAVLAKENKEKSTSEMMARLEKDLKELSAEDREKLGWTDVVIRSIVTQLRSPWMAYFLAANPEEYLQKVQCPVLAINGDKDLQVHVDNLKGIEEALKKGKNKTYQIQAFENLNHLLQTSETGAIEEYVKIEETISPKVLIAIDKWLQEVAIY